MLCPPLANLTEQNTFSGRLSIFLIALLSHILNAIILGSVGLVDRCLVDTVMPDDLVRVGPARDRISEHTLRLDQQLRLQICMKRYGK
jgi:hypothetical protein